MKAACFNLEFDTACEAEIVYNSVNPEVKHKIPKTKINICLNGKTLELKIEAKDTSSLRAACNSYLKWINTALSVNRQLK